MSSEARKRADAEGRTLDEAMGGDVLHPRRLLMSSEASRKSFEKWKKTAEDYCAHGCVYDAWQAAYALAQQEIADLQAKAYAAAVAAGNERIRAEQAESAMAEAQKSLDKWQTVTDYARGTIGSGPGDLQGYIEGLWQERGRLRAALDSGVSPDHLSGGAKEIDEDGKDGKG